MAKRVLVVGATGLVGNYLMDIMSYMDSLDVVGTYSSQQQEGSNLLPLQMENPVEVEAIFKSIRPEVVYIPAFISNVDRCEVDGYARRINLGGILNIVEKAKKYDTQIVFISSAYVFDGTKSKPYSIFDPCMPIQQYGIQKLKCEEMVLMARADSIIVRTSNVIGKEFKRKNYGYRVIDTLGDRKSLMAYDDQLISPIHAHTLASGIIDIVDSGMCGLFHVNGEEEVTKHDFALDLADAFHLPRYLISPITAKDYPQPAIRPYNATLKNSYKTHVTYGQMIGRFVDEN